VRRASIQRVLPLCAPPERRQRLNKEIISQLACAGCVTRLAQVVDDEPPKIISPELMAKRQITGASMANFKTKD
jgi:hypothetical protein